MERSSGSTLAQIRRSAASLSPVDYAVTAGLLAVYVIGTTRDQGPGTSLDFYRSVATVIPTLLITTAVQGRVLELRRRVSFRTRYRTVLFAVVVFAGEVGALMTIARNETNWAAHLFVYLAVLSLGLVMIYLALTGPQPAADGGPGEAGAEIGASPRADPPRRQ